jgi:hypothetical protein
LKEGLKIHIISSPNVIIFENPPSESIHLTKDKSTTVSFRLIIHKSLCFVIFLEWVKHEEFFSVTPPNKTIFLEEVI